MNFFKKSGNSGDSAVKKIANKDTSQTISCLIALAALVILFSLMSPFFLTADNLTTVMLQTVTTALLGFGMTYVIISGAIDLSVAPTLAMSSVIVATLLSNGFPIIVCLLGALGFGLILGFVNGLLITKLNLPAFVATIGTQMAIRGLALVFTDSRAVYISNRPEYRNLAQGRLLGIQYPVYIMLIIAVIATFILRKTVIGRHIYAIGSNEEAARLSGISVHKVRIFAYMFSATMATVAGIITTSRVNSGQPGIAIGYEAYAVAASVIGGVSMSGGHGKIFGTLLGAIIIGVLTNGLNLIGVSTQWQQVATGVTLIVAVYLDIIRQKRRMGVTK